MTTSDTTKASGNGIGFGSLLALAFIVLRLCHVIAWPWVWVLSPLWIPLAFIGLLFLILGLVAVVAGGRS